MLFVLHDARHCCDVEIVGRAYMELESYSNNKLAILIICTSIKSNQHDRIILRFFWHQLLDKFPAIVIIKTLESSQFTF